MAMITILADNTQFKEILKRENTTDFGNFLTYFFNNGQDETTKNNRLNLLCKFFKHDKNAYEILYCACNASTMIDYISDQQCFYSAKITYKCECSEDVIFCNYLNEENVLKDIKNLGDNIKIIPTIKKCKKNHEQIFEIDLNFYIAIEILQVNRKNCHPNDIPKEINVCKTAFKLSSVINFIPPTTKYKNAIGHYQSYLFRNNKKIEVFDNTSQKMLSSAGKVVPHVIIYTKI